MSMMAGLVFRGEIPDTAALTQAMQELGFPISVVPPHYSLEDKKGYRPMLLRGQESGAEFYLEDNGHDFMKEGLADFPDLLAKIDPSFDRAAYFVFGSRWDEVICGTCAAVALTKLTNGIFWEDQYPLVLTVDEAIKYAKETLETPDPTSESDAEETGQQVHNRQSEEGLLERLRKLFKRS
jgi:hypothetical protein